MNYSNVFIILEKSSSILGVVHQKYNTWSDFASQSYCSTLWVHQGVVEAFIIRVVLAGLTQYTGVGLYVFFIITFWNCCGPLWTSIIIPTFHLYYSPGCQSQHWLWLSKTPMMSQICFSVWIHLASWRDKDRFCFTV